VKKSTTLYLTGGGPGALTSLKRHFRTAIRETVKAKHGHERSGTRAKPLVAYVGAASNDDASFFAMIRDAVDASARSVRMVHAKLATPRASASAARMLLEECDLVFVSGRDVEHGMRVLGNKDMVRPLRSLAGAGKPMFGISAGSLMLAREWVRFPDDDSSKAELFPCLGIAPLHVDAHAEEEDWSELRVLVDLLRRRGDPRPMGHGLTRGGALRLTLAPRGAAVRAVGTAIPRVVVRRGKVVDGAPLLPKADRLR